MAFVTDAEVKSALADILAQDVSALVSKWDGIITRANASAYQDILSALGARGYTTAQIAAWLRGPEFNLDIALFWCLVHGGASLNYDDRFIKLLDRRGELATVAVIDAAAAVDSPDDVSPVGQGDMLNTSRDVFLETDGTFKAW